MSVRLAAQECRNLLAAALDVSRNQQNRGETDPSADPQPPLYLLA
jgi:hypothetical protein